MMSGGISTIDLSTALNGIIVLDLSRLLPGPYCTLLLSDLGAEVIKVEEPEAGDHFRHEGPRVPSTNVGYAFAMLNRNKRSVTINLKHEDGRAVFKALLRRSDVLVESFRPGVMQRLGLAYADLKAEHPGLIYCSISGYGQDSPYARWPGHDLNYLAVAGVVHLSGTPPRTAAVPISDFESGQRAALGIVAAVIARGRSGQGQYIDISMTDGPVSWMLLPLADYWATGVPPLRMDEFQDRSQQRFVGLCPGYAIYQAADGKYLSVGASEEKFWRSLCDALGRPDLVDTKMTTQELDAELRAIFASRTQEEWTRVLAEAGTCVAPVNDLPALIADPHVASRGLIGEQHVDGVTMSALASPFGQARAHGDTLGTVAALGADTDSVLEQSGISLPEIRRLRSQGTV